MIPLIPILAVFALVGGGVTLLWYDSLSQEEKDSANQLTADYASALFEKSVSELTKAEANIVHDRVKAHFMN